MQAIILLLMTYYRSLSSGVVLVSKIYAMVGHLKLDFKIP